MSPRTFSRYFATKDAVFLTLIDDCVDAVRRRIGSRQPDELSQLEALLPGARGDVPEHATNAGTGGSDRRSRLLCTVADHQCRRRRLRQAAIEFRPHAVNVELAKRMGVDLDDRGLRLVAAVWSSIIVTALRRPRHGHRAGDWRRIDDAGRPDRGDVRPVHAVWSTVPCSRSDRLRNPPRARLRQWRLPFARTDSRFSASDRRDSRGQKLQSDEVATLQYPGGELDLEIVKATEGSDGIALGSLLAKTGYTTFDGGFVNTVGDQERHHLHRR